MIRSVKDYRIRITHKNEHLKPVMKEIDSEDWLRALNEIAKVSKEHMAKLDLEQRAELYFIKGLVHCERRRYEDAIIDLTLAITFNNDKFEYFDLRSDLLKQTGDKYQGLLDLEISLNLSKRDIIQTNEGRRMLEKIDEQINMITDMKERIGKAFEEQKLDDYHQHVTDFLNVSRSKNIKERLNGLQSFMKFISSIKK